MQERVSAGLARAHLRALHAADRHDRRHADALPGPAAQAYATLKLVLLAAATPVTAPVMAAVALRNTTRIREVISSYPSVIDTIAAGHSPGGPSGRVQRAPSGARYVVTSDLHRGAIGIADMAGEQGTAALYAAMLDAYDEDGRGADPWTLVENGDVEDYWITSGSAYAAAYDVFRMAASAALPLCGRGPLDHVYREHLARIVQRHAPIYERIRDRFHAHGRYVRIVGNHDSVYNHPMPCAALAEVFDGLEVVDYLALDVTGGRSTGVITHGHQTDSWNAAWMDGLGRFSSVLGSTLYDLPLLQLRPGLPTQDESDRLLDGRAASRLMPLNPWFGANAQLYSVDEVRLYEACRAAWDGDGDAPGDAPFGPYLILGHTHVPLVDPVTPDGRGSWRRYLNSGTGGFKGMVTAVEWDGTRDAAAPDVRLVAWRWDPVQPDRPQRLVLGRDGAEPNLRVRSMERA